MPILTPEERLGTLLADRYRLEEIIGRGGAGVLFRAVHRWTGRQVALKMLHEGRGGELSRAARLLAEARAASELKHPNVVEVLDADVVDGAPFVVMELLSGRSMGDEWRMQGAVAPEQVLRWMFPIIGAVATAHRRGILHRDIKLDNIFLATEAPDETVPKLLDFGLARPVDTGSFVTESGSVVGTPAFMAPEQAQGQPSLGPGVDVWALGVVLFALLSGRLPFEGDSPTAVLVKVVTEPAPKLVEIARNVPPSLASAVDRALQRDVGVRYQSAQQLAYGLFVAARKDGVELPAQPDLIGLPQWSRWASEEGVLGGNTDSMSSPGIAAVAVPSHAERSSGRPWVLALASAGVSMAALAGIASWRHAEQNAADATPQLPSARPPVAAAELAPRSAVPSPSASGVTASTPLPPPTAASAARVKARGARTLSPTMAPSTESSAPRGRNPMIIDPNYE